MKTKNKKGMTIESLFEYIDDNVKAFENSLNDHERVLFMVLTPGQRRRLDMFNWIICDTVREMMMAVAEKKLIFEIDKKKKIEGTK